MTKKDIDKATSFLLTENTFFTWKHTYNTIADREDSSYYMDFNLAWDGTDIAGEGLKTKMTQAHKVLFDMFDLVPKLESNSVTITLYGMTSKGIDSTQTIDNNPNSIETNFKVAEIEVDLNKPSQAIFSLLTWMILEPNIFAQVDWNSNNFFNLDIYGIHDFDYTQLGTAQNKISNRPFVWTKTGTGAVFTSDAFKEFQDDFKKIFEFKDIKYFLGFHNHELDDRFNNIIDYILDKVTFYFAKVNRKLPYNSNLIDLRKNR